jgi:hypothetical protein
MTLWVRMISPASSLVTLLTHTQNYLLGAGFRNSSLAILISALSALFQMTFAGFFVHLSSIPPVLRWLQWICPLKYTLEALVVNEVSSGLLIEDTLDGVPVNVSAVLIMQTVRFSHFLVRKSRYSCNLSSCSGSASIITTATCSCMLHSLLGLGLF